jgi:cytochrome b pre-mRNA-processing protein 3|tara:strand:+ start:42 stop:566 length:525 start_codon:yes stop_codon:yes gene_type:complete
MFKFISKKIDQEVKLYNKIVFLSRNKLFYTKMELNDTFQNRIHLIFLHISFIFVKLKTSENEKTYKLFNQEIFDFMFKNIDQNMREIGYGDVSVNKNMKYLVKIFYKILMNCEDYLKKDLDNKSLFLYNYLTSKIDKKDIKKYELVKYFDKYQAFCLDLSLDSVLKGDLNFNYK